jgi:hypothetical protein
MARISERRAEAYYATLYAIIVSVLFLYWGNHIGAYGQVGLLDGRITIGAFCPTSDNSTDCGPAQLYSSRYLSLQPFVGPPIDINLDSDGQFFAYMPVGTYTLNLSECTFVGCSQYFPQLITIKSTYPTVVNATISVN